MARGAPTFGNRDAGQGRMLPWLALAFILVLVDQFTKVLILGAYEYGKGDVVTPFFNIVRHHNTGAAFSFLAAESGWQRWLFTGIAVAAVGFILYLLRSHSAQKLFAFSLACVLGGAVGNAIDRMLHGYVVDFLQVHWQNRWYFPTFNVADIAITAGAIGLILDELLRVRRAK